MDKTTSTTQIKETTVGRQENGTAPAYGMRLTPKAVVKFLSWVILFLFLFQLILVVSESWGYDNKVTEYVKHFFNFHSENNFPAYISSLLLLFGGLLAILISFQVKALTLGRWLQWRVLGFLFLFLAFDESIQIHEVISQGLRNNLEERLPGYLYYVWVVPYFLFVVAAVLFFFKLVLELPRNIRNLIFISGFVYVSAALGLEVVESYVFNVEGQNNMLYILLVTVEELFEMVGVTIFIYALLKYLGDLKGNLVFEPGHSLEGGDFRH